MQDVIYKQTNRSFYTKTHQFVNLSRNGYVDKNDKWIETASQKNWNTDTECKVECPFTLLVYSF